MISNWSTVNYGFQDSITSIHIYIKQYNRCRRYQRYMNVFSTMWSNLSSYILPKHRPLRHYFHRSLIYVEYRQSVTSITNYYLLCSTLADIDTFSIWVKTVNWHYCGDDLFIHSFDNVGISNNNKQLNNPTFN